MNKLIIAEKPSVAFTLAIAFSQNNPQKKTINGVPYYEIPYEGDTLYIVAAAGHLFTIRQKEGTSGFPVFGVEWVASYKQGKSSYFTKKYLDTIEIIGKKCSIFVNACDYDIEGSVIGTNIIRFLSGNVNGQINTDNVQRMKFSTTTRADLLEAYGKIERFDAGNFEAGETRHMLDWMWGINMSRAMMHALYTIGIKRIISIGRVQGPALAILARRELEIRNFVSKPFWTILLKAKGVEFTNTKGGIFERSEAEKALKTTKEADAFVEGINKVESKIRPYPPFDLTTLQIEASKAFRIDPSQTLKIAQSLYEKTYTSYPRTSSQKLPFTLNLPRIISELAKIERYRLQGEFLIQRKMFRPNEGAKEDEAHPAIYPTGVMPKGLSEEEEKIYDIITRRFLACFGNYATLSQTTVTINAAGEKYSAQGKLYTSREWIELYMPYFKAQDTEMPAFEQNEKIVPEKVQLKEQQTKPPSRFNKASLISLLERKDLGTKATRAEIIETLFRREYIKGIVIEVTDFGMSVYKALSENLPDIIEENLTKQLDKDMEKITKGALSETQVVDEGKRIIQRLIEKFKANEKKVGQALSEGLKANELADVLGKCNKDDGNLVVKRSNAGKQFVSCSNWPKCNVSYPLPQYAKIVPTKKVCDKCHTPYVKVFRRGKRPFEMDLDPNCETKKDWGTQKQSSQEPELKAISALQAKKAMPKKSVRRKAVGQKTKTTKVKKAK